MPFFVNFICKTDLQNIKNIFARLYRIPKNCITGAEKNLVYKLITTEYPNFAGLLKRKIPESCCQMEIKNIREI